MVRWRMLVRAAGMSFSYKDAFRLGFLGFLLNFVSVGAVGGDLFKAVFIAREQPGRRIAAIVSVALDRLLGQLGDGELLGTEGGGQGRVLELRPGPLDPVAKTASPYHASLFTAVVLHTPPPFAGDPPASTTHRPPYRPPIA